ncbi:hypothetical protein Tco_0639647 [Tanacetum coccineum]
MVSLRFVDRHNMVAFLSKPAEAEGFEQIVDFLNAHPIRFVQLFLDQVIDDPSNHKRKYITPSHTKKIFGNMKRVGKCFSGIVTPLFPAMVELSQSASQLGEGTGGAATNIFSLDAGQGSGNIHKTPSISHDLLTRGLENDMKKTKTAHALEITSLNIKIKRVKSSSSDDDNLEEDASIQGRKSDCNLFDKYLNADEEINIDNVDENVDNVDEDVVMEAQEVEDVVEEVVDVISTGKVLLSTAREKVSIASEKVSTIYDNLSIACIQPSVTTTTSSSQQSQHSKDKGKGILVKEPTPLKKKHQLLQDEEDARRLQAEFDEEDRIARE